MRPKQVCDAIGWCAGLILSMLSLAAILYAPCQRLDWPLRPTCKVVEKMNLRPFTVASFR
jgi:hypothetical protein